MYFFNFSTIFYVFYSTFCHWKVPDDPDLSARAACGSAPASKLRGKGAGKVEGSPGSRFLGSGARRSDRRVQIDGGLKLRATPMVNGRRSFDCHRLGRGGAWPGVGEDGGGGGKPPVARSQNRAAGRWSSTVRSSLGETRTSGRGIRDSRRGGGCGCGWRG